MRNVSDESCTEDPNSLFMFSKLFFRENRAVYVVMWTNMVDADKQQMTI
jgi:hypothetical protein